MFRFLKKILHRSGTETGNDDYVSAEEMSPLDEAAATPEATLSQPIKSQNNGHNQAGKTVEVPLQPVLANMPLELQSRVRQSNVGDATLLVPLERILAQLSHGVVKLPFGDIRHAFPAVFTKDSDLDKIMVPLPLSEVLSRLNPALIKRRRTQRQVEVPSEISSPFEEQFGLGGYSEQVAEPATEPALEETFESETAEPEVAQEEVAAEPFVRQTSVPAANTSHLRNNLFSAPTPQPPSATPPVAPPAVSRGRNFRDLQASPPQPSGHSTQPPFKATPPQTPRTGTEPPFKPASPQPLRQGHATQPPIKPVPQAPRKGTELPIKPASPPPLRKDHLTAPPIKPVAPPIIRQGQATQPPFKATPVARPQVPSPAAFAPKPAPTPKPAPAPSEQPVPPVEAPRAAESQPAVAAAPTVPSAPAVAAPTQPAANSAPLVTTLVSLADAWPDNVRKEIVQAGLVDTNVHLPPELIERGLKQGRVAFTWRIVRSWIHPAQSGSSSNDGTLVELPLKVVAPLFLARQQEAAKGQAHKVEVDEDIPNLFFGFPQGPEADAAAAATAKPADTNFYVWNDTSDGVKVAESDLKRGPSAGTRFVSKYATPNEIVSRTAALDGVAGALVALPDGLLVASRLPSDLNADTLAAFLPQIFGKVAQCTKELRMGELNNLNFTVGNVPWKIFRVNAIFFAAFGRAGEPLPTAQLAALAGELDHKPR